MRGEISFTRLQLLVPKITQLGKTFYHVLSILLVKRCMRPDKALSFIVVVKIQLYISKFRLYIRLRSFLYYYSKKGIFFCLPYWLPDRWTSDAFKVNLPSPPWESQRFKACGKKKKTKEKENQLIVFLPEANSSMAFKQLGFASVFMSVSTESRQS